MQRRLARQRRSANRRDVVRAALIVLAVISIIYLAGNSGLFDPGAWEAKPPDHGRDAFYASRNAIKKMLKAPATAKFSSPLDQDSGYSGGDSNVWTAWGWVDSQNAFGAMLRMKWYSAHQLQPDGDLKPLYFKVGEDEIGDPQAFRNAIR